MSTPHNERRDYEQLDEAIGHSTHKLFNMSPNDVLVQIALPVVLILAIATRLITIGQGLNNHSRDQAVMDLWKQHLILRVDRALDEWEQQSQLQQFSDLGRIYWDGAWPRDERLSQLCKQAHDLADLEGMRTALYRRSLTYQPGKSPAEGAEVNWTALLYDPLYSPPGMASNNVPADFRIDEARRQFALQYIGERCKRWRGEIEALQWKLVEHLASRLPAGSPLADARLDIQMRNIARALDEHGYPLLPAICGEYGREPHP